MSADPISQALGAAFGLSRDGRHTEALAALDAIGTHAASDPRVHALRGRVLWQGGDAIGARAAIDAALALDPYCAPALVEDAALARSGGEIERAIGALTRLTTVVPQQPAFWFDLGILSAEHARPDQAHRAYTRVLALAPAHLEARFQRANLDAAAGRRAEAIADYRQCLALRPGWREALLNLGEMLLMDDQHAAAADVWQQAVQVDPQAPRTWDGLARAAKAARRFELALAARLRVAELDDTPPAWALLGMEQQRVGDLAAARDAYEHALLRDPDYLPARWGRFQVPRGIVHRDAAAMQGFRADWLAELAWFEAAPIESTAPAVLIACITLATEYYIHYLGEPLVAEQRRYGALLERMMAAAFRDLAPAAKRSRADARVRIGFCSGFLRTHTVSKLFASLPGALARERWEISCFHTANLIDAGTDAWRANADHFVHGEHDLGWWVNTIRDRDLDLLVYIDIGMHPFVQGLASLRLAPRQAMLWGHPISSGRSTIDFFLTADAMEADDGQRFYSEKLLRLPNLGTCYAAPRTLPSPPPELQTRAPDAIEFFVAQQAVKLLPLHDAVFARIAAQIRNARFHFVPSPFAQVRDSLRTRLRAHFADAGLDFEQHCGVFRFVTEAEFLGIGRSVDVNLDSIGWSGGNTTLELLYFDTPTVTLPGPLMRSRHTFAMLRILELQRLIATDIDDYVRIALELGRSADFRVEMRGLINARKHRLYDDPQVGPAFAAMMEQVLRG